MRIEREKDKVFLITLSDDEADRLANSTETDFLYVRQYTGNFGRILLNFIIECCTYPTHKHPTFEVEL
ncbi:hypothetical protein ES703_82174 [subsurface metagenome]